MATYINGVTDYIPKLQPFQPDLNFYNNVLQTKEAQYAAGYEKISKLYGTLLNSPMLRETDINKRDQYFKDIHQEIQRMSMVDLSMPQNVTQARKVFQPILDDKNIVSDIAYTKKWNSEKSYAESLRDCVDSDKKKCKGWWQDGVDNLNYWAQDYSRTTDEEALKYDWSPRYVPFVNVEDRFSKLVKDMKLKVTSTSFTGDGRFIVEQTNGQQMTIPLTSFLMGSIGNDPAVADMYKVKAENYRHQWINSNAAAYNGDYGLAEDAYNSQLQSTLESLKKDKTSIDKSNQTIGSKINVVKQKINQMPNGVSEDNPLIADLKLLMQEKAVADAASSQAEDAISTVERTGIFSEDRLAKRRALDYGLGYLKMHGDLSTMAETYSQLTSQTKLKVNQYQLNAEKHANQVALAKLKHTLGLERDFLKNQYKQQENLEKARRKGEAPPATIPNTYAPNSSDEVVKGAGANKEDVLQSQLEQKHKGVTEWYSYQAKAVKQFYNDLANAADTESDPIKKQYAIDQLTQLFGAEKGEDGSYSTRQLKNPSTYYNQVVALSKDNVYNTAFPGFSDKIYRDVENANIELHAIAAYNKTTEKNVANLYTYLETKSGTLKGASKEDIIKMKAVIDERYGTTRKLADIQKRLAAAGINVDAEEAAEISEDYTALFRDHYSAGYTVGQGVNQSPIVRGYDWHPGMPVNTGGTAAYPSSATVGSSYSSLNQATVDVLTMYDWMRKNQSAESYKLYAGAGVTKDQKGEEFNLSESNRQNDFLQYALGTLRKEVPLKPSQSKLSEGMSVTLHPVIMNDKNMRGFSVQIPEALFNKWKKDQGKSATGSYEDYSNFTVVMPADKAPDDVFGRFDPKPIKAILRNGGTVKITHPNGGDLKLYGNADGSIGVSGTVNWVGQDGKLTTGSANTVGMNPFVDPDYLYNRLSTEIQQLGEKNFQMIQSPYNPINVGKITSGEQAEQYVRAQQAILGQ